MVSYNSILDIDITTWPNTEPVSLSEAKDFCRIDIGTDDNIILALITAARQQCEAYTNIAFAEYEMTVVLNNENGETLLPYGPLITILQVTDEDGNVLIADEGYTTSGNQFVRLLTPHERNITVEYITGYTNLPEVLKTALLNAIYYLYDNRSEGADDIGPIAKMLLKPYRRV